jgi:hypothetical protein
MESTPAIQIITSTLTVKQYFYAREQNYANWSNLCIIINVWCDTTVHEKICGQSHGNY